MAQPRPAPGGLRDSRSSPFAPRASRVVRALLSDPGRSWRLSDVAVLCDLNPGNVHRALAALVDRGMVERDQDAYVVAEPGSMLEAWADQHQVPRERMWLRPGGDLRAFVRKLVSQLDGKAVVSGELAAEELAPHLAAESAIVHVLDPQRFAELPPGDQPLSSARLNGSPGQVLLDLADKGYGDFRVDRQDLPLSSPARVYIDLARDRGRGREAGEHLRRHVIGF